MASSTSSFKHTPLQDATEEIRLLQFVYGWNEDDLVLQLSYHKLEDATEPIATGPTAKYQRSRRRQKLRIKRRSKKEAVHYEYFAVSYTWGDPDESVVIVNRKNMVVRQSCFDVLQQVRRHFPDAWEWIGSVCIEPDNTSEKSSQVALMANVYKQSAEVVACIGHVFGLDWLLIEMRYWREEVQWWYCTLEDRRHPSRWLDNSQEEPRLGEQWDTESAYFATLYDNFGRSAGMWDALVGRVYWGRLWTVQELNNNNALVIAGNTMTSIDTIESIMEIEEFSSHIKARELDDHRRTSGRAELKPYSKQELMFRMTMSYAVRPYERTSLQDLLMSSLF